MPAGELNAAHRFELDLAIRQAEQLSRFEFSVFLGSAEGDPRTFATRLHNTLVAPARSVLILVDPLRRVLEIVTGGDVRRRLTDREVALVAVQMRSAFAAADLVGGLRRGISMLGEHATAPPTLHAG
ncbi:DUF5130 family protein [Nocardioides pantholopis]|uniref:DUF5130 family protein n=1 Tax=Nocardioides pantholopis TaxID=2483798 RepID=UPI000F07C48D|nr:DUF5130 family protein [Nocardioides pantholopis]